MAHVARMCVASTGEQTGTEGVHGLYYQARHAMPYARLAPCWTPVPTLVAVPPPGCRWSLRPCGPPQPESQARTGGAGSSCRLRATISANAPCADCCTPASLCLHRQATRTYSPTLPRAAPASRPGHSMVFINCQIRTIAASCSANSTSFSMQAMRRLAGRSEAITRQVCFGEAPHLHPSCVYGGPLNGQPMPYGILALARQMHAHHLPCLVIGLPSSSQDDLTILVGQQLNLTYLVRNLTSGDPSG